MIRSLWSFLVLLVVCVSPCLAGEPASEVTPVSIPGAGWALEIDLKGVEIKHNSIDNTGERASLGAFDRKTGIAVNVLIEKAQAEGGYKAAKDYYWKKLTDTKPELKNVEVAQKPDRVIVDYSVVKVQEKAANQRNTDVYMARGGYWIVASVSLMKDDPRMLEKVSSIRDSIRVNEKYEHTINDCLRFGSVFYMAKDHAGAARWYQEALDKEKKAPVLNENFRKAMIDNLGITYWVLGEHGKARDVYRYGISRDKEFPMYYFHLAEICAVENDLKGVLGNLELAISYKNNVLPGEVFPDIAKDKNFEKYLTNDKFKKLLETAKK